MPEEDWAALEPLVRASFDSLRADPRGPNAPAAPPPPPPLIEEPAVVAAVAIGGATLGIPQPITHRAASMRPTPYAWGGNDAMRAAAHSAYRSLSCRHA